MTSLPRTIRWSAVAACALALAAAHAEQNNPPAHAQGGFTFPYNYLPSADITDGRFLAQAGTKMETLVGVGSDYEIYLEDSQIDPDGNWQLGIFDGDTGKNAAGTVTASFESGHWDWIKTMPVGGREQLIYQLFEDPDGTVNPLTATPKCTFLGNKATSLYTCTGAYTSTTYSHSSGMPDNEWFDISMPAEVNRYRLYVKFANPGVSVESAFRLRSSGAVTTVSGKPFQLLGAARRRLDYGVLYPGWDVSTYPGTPVLSPTNYDGEWSVYVELPAGENRLDIWDGDLDHGSSNGTNPDTNDPDTLSTDIPPGGPYGNQAMPEAAMAKGSPSDDLIGVSQARWRRSPAIEYTIYDPEGTAYRNANPSGNREWEKFTICQSCSDQDYTSSSLPGGLYEIRIQGHDLDNINALLLGQEAFVIVKNGDAALGDTVWYDTDDDGFKDATESGIAGVTITVTRDVNVNGQADNGEPTWTDVTDSSGLYLVEELADGQYVVEVSDGAGTPLANFSQSTTDAAHQTDLSSNDQWNKTQSYVARITDETDNLTADFGYVSAGAGTFRVGNTVWNDEDADGTQDEGVEYGIPGITLEIYLDWDAANGLNGDGSFDGDEIYLGTATTNSSGEYYYTVPFDGASVEYFVKVADENFDDGAVLEHATQTPVYGAQGATGSSAAGPDTNRASPYRAPVFGQDNLTADFGYRSTFTTGDFCTWSVGAYSNGNPGTTYLVPNWNSVLGGTLTIGIDSASNPPYDATWTDVGILRTAMGGGGSSGQLSQDYMNTTSLTSGGTLAKQTAALDLSIRLSEAGILGNGTGSLGDLYYCVQGDTMSGKTLSEILSIANDALATGTLPNGYTFGTLNTLVGAMNNPGFEGGGCVPGVFAQANLSRLPCGP